MVDISKYTLNGTCFFENIQRLRNSYSRRIDIGRCCNVDFYILLKKKIVNDQLIVFPAIGGVGKSEMSIGYYFTIRKRDGSSGITEEKWIVLEPFDTLNGPKINLETLENEGYLENGGIMIQYGLHILSFRDINGVWNVNFWNASFNGDHCSVKVLKDGGTKQLYGHKQIFTFHYNTTNDEIVFRNQKDYIINYILQTAHGVHKQVQWLPYSYGYEYTFVDVLSCAVHYNLPNVVRIIEMQLMKNELFFNEEGFEIAVFWKLPHLLAQLLKESEKDFVISKLTKYCRKPEILERMSGESIKQLMKFLLDY